MDRIKVNSNGCLPGNPGLVEWVTLWGVAKGRPLGPVCLTQVVVKGGVKTGIWCVIFILFLHVWIKKWGGEVNLWCDITNLLLLHMALLFPTKRCVLTTKNAFNLHSLFHIYRTSNYPNKDFNLPLHFTLLYLTFSLLYLMFSLSMIWHPSPL